MAKKLFVDTESQPPGTAVNSSNADFVGTAGSLTYDNSQAFHDTQSVKVGPSAGGGSFGTTVISSTSVSMWGYAYFTSSPVTDTYLCRFVVGGSRVVSLHVNGAGKLRLSDSSGTSGVFSASAVIPLGSWFRWEIFMAVGGTATTGTIQFAYYLGDSTTPIQGYTPTPGTSKCGTTPITRLNLGKADGGSYPAAYWADDAGYDDAASGMPGPFVDSTPASVGAVRASASGAAFEPVVVADSVVSGGGPAVGSAVAVAPSVAGMVAVSVAAVPGSGAGLAFAPVVVASRAAAIVAVRAPGSGVAVPPVVAAAATTTSVLASGAGVAKPPTVDAQAAAMVSGVRAGGSGVAVGPVVAGLSAAGVTAVPASGSGSVFAPSVVALAAVAVAAVRAVGSGVGRAPSVQGAGTSNVLPPAASGSGFAVAPVVGGSRTASVNAPRATAVGVAAAPLVSAGGIGVVAAVTASGGGTASTPTVGGSRVVVVTAVTSTGSLVAYAPTMRTGSGARPPTAAGSAVAGVPSVSFGANVNAPTALGSGMAHPVRLGDITRRDITVTGSIPPRGWGGAIGGQTRTGNVGNRRWAGKL